jgi:SPP1 family predicted phage head-tail adaptor
MASPGKLDQRVTFQTATLTSDGMGGSTRAWGSVPSTPTVWANVRAMGGTEAMQADQQQATTRYLFTVRNRTDISEDDRIVWRSENYNIRRIEREGTRKMYLIIEAERGVAD